MNTFKNTFLLLFFFASAFSFKSNAQEPQNPGDVAGIKLLTLTNEEFLKLGVHVEAKRLLFLKEVPLELARLPIGREITLPANDIAAGKLIQIGKFSVSMNGISAGDIAPKSDVKKFGIATITPRIITSYRNQKLMGMFWESRDSASMKFIHTNARSFKNTKSFNSLIPLHTVLKDPNAKNFKETDVIMWYEATPEFASLLPERFKNVLLKEIASGEKPDTIESKEHFSEKPSTQAGAIIQANVYPNPVRGRKATIDFSLSEERIITIALHDIFGRKLLDLVSAQLRSKGDFHREIVLKDIAQGMYLISIRTERGEQAIQRVLVD